MALKIPGYDILEQIGKGGMAEVYRARHNRLNRDVALKVMHAHYSDDPSFAERFIREARIAASLNHPNIVQIYDVNRAEEILFLAMEYVSGGDLTHNFLPPINQKVLLNLLAQLCNALDYANKEGYIHRDIKPANILFRENGTLALTDFGIARAIHSNTNLTQTGSVIGTPSYMSPEQAQGFELTGASDLYSAAVIVYQYVTGELPYQADSSITIAIKHISDPIPTLPPTLQPLQSFFNRALAKQPSQRFASGKEMFQHLKAAVAKLPVTPPGGKTSIIIVADDEADAFANATLTNPAIHSLENNLLDDYTAQRAHAHEVMKTGDSLGSGGDRWSVTSLPQRTLRFIFIQVNKIVVHIFPAGMSGYIKGLITAGVLGIVLGLAYFLIPFQPPAANLNEEQRLQIAQLLVAADKNVQQGQLVSPANDNALQKYQAILLLAPNDTLASSGINSLANTFAVQANSELMASDVDGARLAIANLTKVAPDHESLDDLGHRLNIVQQTIEEDISGRLQLAQQLNEQTRYSEALEIYRGLADQYPQHTDTFTQVRNVTQAMLRQADAHIQDQQFEDAAALVEDIKAAATLTNDAEAIDKAAQIQKLADRQEKTAAREAQLSHLLAQADQAMKNYHMDRPKQGSAWDIFNQVLALSPNNKQAKEGQQSILNWLERSVKSASEKGEIDKATSYITRLEALQANHPRLRQLQKTVANAKKDVARKRAIEEKVTELYRRADIYLQRNKAKSADKIHRKISALSPRDKGLHSLGLRIADSYAVLAQRELDAADWRDAEVWVSRGLAHAPNHRTLRRQQAEAAKALQGR